MELGEGVTIADGRRGRAGVRREGGRQAGWVAVGAGVAAGGAVAAGIGVVTGRVGSLLGYGMIIID